MNYSSVMLERNTQTVGADSVILSAKIQQATIAAYQFEVRAHFLSYLVMPSTDPAFQLICRELAQATGLTTLQASNALWPTARKIYRAAERAGCCSAADNSELEPHWHKLNRGGQRG